jgi:hypothetical protein
MGMRDERVRLPVFLPGRFWPVLAGNLDGSCPANTRKGAKEDRRQGELREFPAGKGYSSSWVGSCGRTVAYGNVLIGVRPTGPVCAESRGFTAAGVFANPSGWPLSVRGRCALS